MQLKPKHVTVLVALIVLVTISLVGTEWFWRKSVASWTAKESAYNLNATVTSLSSLGAKGSSQEDALEKVCFTIENFNSLRPEMRQEYEVGERERFRRAGPWCRAVRDSPKLADLSVGSHILVVFTLENSGSISPQRFIVKGSDILWETPTTVNQKILDTGKDH